MPAKSEAQRRLLNARFGHAWVKAHGFDNAGRLPARVGKKKRKKPVRKKSKKKSKAKAKARRTKKKRPAKRRRMY